MAPQVVRYSERPELWDAIAGLSGEVWPEYNQHGATLNHYWDQLYESFPDWQFVLYDAGDETVLAEGHTIPVAWDGTDTGLGPGIDATVTAAFGLRAAGGQPTAVSALAAEIPPRHQRRGLAKVMLQAMTGLARDAGLPHLIAPVRPTLKDRYPTIPIERYARWTRPDGTPFDPWVRVHTELGARIGPAIPARCISPAPSATGNPGPRCASPRPATTSSRPGSPPFTSTATTTPVSTGNPTSGSSTTSVAGHQPDRAATPACDRRGRPGTRAKVVRPPTPVMSRRPGRPSVRGRPAGRFPARAG